MKILFYFLFFIISLSASETYFTTDPSPSPDGSKITFVYDGDIWVVDSDGGSAYRLTGMDGYESEPAFSPDGKWIAFTGRRDGNPNVYVMPSGGGEITQLTFHDDADYVESWSWDSKYIYFSSGRYNYKTAFKVAVAGRTPVQLFDNYFNWPHNIVEHPGKNKVYFNTSWESYRFPMRKRYVGAFNPDVQSYDFDTKEYKILTTFEGKDLWPTIDKNGNLYFASVEYNEEYNLYKFDSDGNKVRLTGYERSLKRPKVSAGGNIIVFEKDYQIYKYDVDNGETKLIPVSLFKNESIELNKEFGTAGKISAFDISPDNKKITYVSRGRLFVSDIEGKFSKELNTDSGERVLDVKWMKDNETILYTQTVKGWLNLFTIKAGGNGKPDQITADEKNNQALTLNKDRTKGLYQSGRNELKMIDLETMKSYTIVTDEFWAIYPTPAYFSPDDKYVVYTAYRNFEQDIFIYDTENKTTAHLTKTGVSETNPYWSPDGKYVYFTTNRTEPTYPNGFEDANIYRIALRNYDKEFKSDEYEKLFTGEKKDTSKPVVKIDYNNLEERWESIVDKPLNQFGTYVIRKDEKIIVLYSSNHDNKGWNLWQTIIKPFEDNETKKIEGAEGNDWQIVEAGDKYYLRMNNDIYKLDLDGSKAEKISVDQKFSKNLKSEFTQMFYETWANMQENFYDENFHGINWEDMRNYYSQFLPYVETRDDLRRIFEDMFGELNSSHLGFSTSGEEEKTFYENQSANTGIMFEEDHPFTVKYVVKNSPAYKDDKNIIPGDVLISVNGIKTDKNINREKYFISPTKQGEITLGLERDGNNYSVKIHPVSSGELETLLYDEWMDNNQKRVDDESDKQIAYIHMKNMTGSELERFKREIADEWHYRDALILDIRYNRGGNVHNQVLQLLSQKSYLQWKYRGGKFTPQPNFAPSDKPIVLLVNEQSLSDAEMTAEGFQTLGLGKIIGTETYRWIIFTSGKTLVDGSYYRLPSWGCYTLEGDNIEKVGVTPDIQIDNTFKDRLEGKDPQLDKAIEVIMNDMK